MIQRDDGDLKIISEEGAANVKFGDIETTFGLVHIIDSVLIWNKDKLALDIHTREQ